MAEFVLNKEDHQIVILGSSAMRTIIIRVFLKFINEANRIIIKWCYFMCLDHILSIRLEIEFTSNIFWKQHFALIIHKIFLITNKINSFITNSLRNFFWRRWTVRVKLSPKPLHGAPLLHLERAIQRLGGRKPSQKPKVAKTSQQLSTLAKSSREYTSVAKNAKK